MALRGALYRCHLFSFGGPQTEGVESRWTKGLHPIGEREMLSGEVVELLVTVDSRIHTLTTDARVRFDILEEDYLLTGGLDDKVVALVGAGAAPPEEGFSSEPRTPFGLRLAAGQSLADGVDAFKRERAEAYRDHVLLVEEPGVAVHLLTWWTAERREDFARSEFYFIVNINDELEDQSEPVLTVSPTWAPTAAPEGLAPSDEVLIAARWGVAQARPGELVDLIVESGPVLEGHVLSIEILSGLLGDTVDSFDMLLMGHPPYKTSWRLPATLDVDELSFFAALFAEEVGSRGLRVIFDLRTQLVDALGAPVGGVAYRVLGPDQTIVRQGRSSSDGRIEERDLPPGARWLELDDAVIDGVEEPPAPAQEPALPLAAGRLFSFIRTPEDGGGQ